ncbi:Hypp2479 [Branchiostoma lanceolatum]|uniref:Hypp2479 protein n=1 Tax=Branchiostoma lanceolatum TaxID=7740 RepID=A0A8J9ZQW5_BRALA|nr:Hypp2479 [Branchiostoma lanceolatum]
MEVPLDGRLKVVEDGKLLPCQQSPRCGCIVTDWSEVWLGCYDVQGTTIAIYNFAKQDWDEENVIVKQDAYVQTMVYCNGCVVISFRGQTCDMLNVFDAATHRQLEEYTMPSLVQNIACSSSHLYFGLASGTIKCCLHTELLHRPAIHWTSCKNGPLPVKAMVCVRDDLWVAAGSKILVYTTTEWTCKKELLPDTENELNEVFLMDSCDDEDKVWTVCTMSGGIVTGWKGVTMTVDKESTYDCGAQVRRLSDRCSSSPFDKMQDETITCLTSSCGQVWVGTGIGVVLVWNTFSHQLCGFFSPFENYVRCLLSFNSVQNSASYNHLTPHPKSILVVGAGKKKGSTCESQTPQTGAGVSTSPSIIAVWKA